MIKSTAVLLLSTTLSSFAIFSYALSKGAPVLPEGARIIAGDLSKDEFFILGKGENLPTKPTSAKVLMARNSTKKNAKEISM